MDKHPGRGRAEAGLWLGFGILQSLMATIIGIYALLRGKPVYGLGAIAVAVLTIAAAMLRLRQLAARRRADDRAAAGERTQAAAGAPDAKACPPTSRR
ncbi:hypothetical protein IP88_07255 [alpha proteobacterium AAP81b]|nr:hypothetical protein IP88_07255 [alpha proteobacterium AAP81b]